MMTTIIKITTHLLTFFILFSSAQGIANTQNLINNPGFENNISDWSSRNSTIASSSVSYAGKTSVIAINRDTNTAGPEQDITKTLRNSGKGQYNLQAYIKLAAGTGVGRVTISIDDDKGRNYHSISNGINAEKFSQVNGSINLHWSGTLHSARLHVETGRETTATMFVDEVVLSPASTERPSGPTAYYSYQSDLSNPQPLKGATLEPRQTYFFISDNDQFKKVNFYCCKGFSGNAAGEPHNPVISDLTAPFSFSHNTAKMASGTRELYFDGFTKTGAIENHSILFKLGEKIAVKKQNIPPVITGTPAKRVTQSSPYFFQPFVKDTENNPLTFSISGQPAWAIFDTHTGRLSGVPVKGENGNYNNIIISVSDGTNTAHLPAFNIKVEPVIASEEKPILKVYYSYNSNFSNAKLLEGAVLQTRQTYFFISGNEGYKKVVFYCCKGLTGNAANEPHLPAIADNNAPYSFSLNTDGMASGIRELYFDRFLSSGEVENHKVYFNLIASQSKKNTNQTQIDPIITNDSTTNKTAEKATNKTTAFYSYQNDLSSPKPLDGAILEPRQTYFFITDNGQYKATTFYCCKGISGNAAGESHLPSVVDTTSPYRFSQDTTGMSTGTRELYFDTFPLEGGVENHSVNFSVTGNTNLSGQFTVKWIAPIGREDGSPLALSEIAGYTLHYGRSSGNYTNHIKVGDHSATSKTIYNIPKGSYYVVLTARDTNDRESSYSKEIVINTK